MLKKVMVVLLVFAGYLFCPISQSDTSTINSITSATTKEVLYQTVLKGVLDPFLDDYTKQSAADWVAFSGVCSTILNNSSKNNLFWTTPFIGAAGSQKSLRDYFYAQLAFVIDDLSPASGPVKDDVRKLLIRLVSAPTQADSSLIIPTRGSNFVFKVASSDKVLFVKDDGKVVSQTASYFLQNTSFRVFSVDASSGAILLCSSKNFVFDKSAMSFSLATNNSAGLSVFIQKDQSSGNYYLVTPDRKYFNVSSDSLALSDTGTLFEMISVPLELYTLEGTLSFANATDIDAAIAAFIKAIECCSKNSADLAKCIDLLKSYCFKASLSSDWSISIDKSIIKRSSPSFFVKKYLTTLLSLPWYSGLTDVLRKSIDDFTKEALFASVIIPIDLIASDALAVFQPTVDGIGCYAPDTGNFYLARDVIDFDVSTHLIIDSFEASTSQVSFSVQGKKVSTDTSTGRLLFGAGASTLFKIIQTSDPIVYGLHDSNGRRLVVNSTNSIGFFSPGTPVVLKKIPSDKRVTEGLSGDTFNDLNILEKLVFDVRASQPNLVYAVSLLLGLVDRKKSMSSWFIEKGVDLSGQSFTGNEYSVALLKRIRDNSTDLFTGASSELLTMITAALTSSEDKSMIYSKLLENLDQLATAAKKEDLVATSVFAQSITDLATQFASAEVPSLRSNLISKIDTYYEPSTSFSAVSGVADLTEWSTYLFNASLSCLSFNLSDSTLVYEQIDYLKNTIVPRLLKFNPTLRNSLLTSFCTTAIKKVVDSITQLALSGPAVDSLKKIVKDFKDLVSGLATSSERTAALTVVLSLDSALNPKKKIQGLTDLSSPGDGLMPGDSAAQPAPADSAGGSSSKANIEV